VTNEATNLCHCGRPSPQAFLCPTCTTELERAIADLGAFIPELGVAATRMDRTTSGPIGLGPGDLEELQSEARAVPAMLRTAHGQIALTATTDPVGHAAADLLAEVRNELVTTVRHVCEARGLDYREAIEGATA
jgi:hypothetical protein